jgi:hypothetical protein
MCDCESPAQRTFNRDHRRRHVDLIGDVLDRIGGQALNGVKRATCYLAKADLQCRSESQSILISSQLAPLRRCHSNAGRCELAIATDNSSLLGFGKMRQLAPAVHVYQKHSAAADVDSIVIIDLQQWRSNPYPSIGRRVGELSGHSVRSARQELRDRLV